MQREIIEEASRNHDSPKAKGDFSVVIFFHFVIPFYLEKLSQRATSGTALADMNPRLAFLWYAGKYQRLSESAKSTAASTA